MLEYSYCTQPSNQRCDLLVTLRLSYVSQHKVLLLLLNVVYLSDCFFVKIY